jgi:hypothetical protein
VGDQRSETNSTQRRPAFPWPIGNQTGKL